MEAVVDWHSSTSDQTSTWLIFLINHKLLVPLISQQVMLGGLLLLLTSWWFKDRFIQHTHTSVYSLQLVSWMHTSSKSSSSHFIIRLVMLSRIVWSSDWYPSSSSSSSSSSSLLSALRLVDRCMFCSHSRQCTVQLTRWAWRGAVIIYSSHEHSKHRGTIVLQCRQAYQRLLEVDLVSVSCDAGFQLHRGQEVLLRLVVPPQLKMQRHTAVYTIDNMITRPLYWKQYIPVRRGSAWWSLQVESCDGEHHRNPEIGENLHKTFTSENI